MLVFTMLTIVCSMLVVSAGVAGAAVPQCSPGDEVTLGAVDDPTPATAYHVAFGQKLTVPAATGVLANDCGPSLAPGTRVSTDPDVFLTDTESWFGIAAVKVNADGSFTYTPDPFNPFSGPDMFSYSIITGPQTDPTDSASAVVNIVVDPIIRDDTYSTLKNKQLVVNAPGIFANDLGIDPDSLTYDPFTAQNVELTVESDGSFVYVPPPNFTGQDSFQYTVTDLSFDTEYTRTVRINVTNPPPPPPPKPKGYWMVDERGRVYPFGQVKNWGNANTIAVVHIEPTPTKLGYWIVNAFGQVFRFGDAKALTGVAASVLRKNEFVSSLSSTPTGKGYWIFTNRGKVFTRGDAKFFGDVRNLALAGPVVGSVATPTGKGYYMVASDGGIFAFGDANFYGSMGGVKLNKPVNGLVPDGDNKGYWLVASDGGIFAFQAPFRGSMGGKPLNKPIIGMVRYGNGYLMVASDGGIFSFSNLPFFGSLGGVPIPAPIASVGAGG